MTSWILMAALVTQAYVCEVDGKRGGLLPKRAVLIDERPVMGADSTGRCNTLIAA